MDFLERLAVRLFDPATRIDPYKLLAAVNAILGLLVLIFNVGMPRAMYDETGIPRYWYIAVCFLTALLVVYRKTPGIYLLMVMPVFFYAVGTGYIASIDGNWHLAGLMLFLLYHVIRHWGDIKDVHNGLNPHVD